MDVVCIAQPWLAAHSRIHIDRKEPGAALILSHVLFMQLKPAASIVIGLAAIHYILRSCELRNTHTTLRLLLWWVTQRADFIPILRKIPTEVVVGTNAISR